MSIEGLALCQPLSTWRIDMAKAQKLKIKLVRDYWFEADVRTLAGTVVDVDEATAKKAMDAGLASFEGLVTENDASV